MEPVRLLHVPIPCDADSDRLARAVLTQPERDRIDRIRSPSARRCRAIVRALLRYSGAAETRLAPASWPLAEGSDGKPYCPLPAAIRFNLSHSGDETNDPHALLALSCAEVGVDLEIARPVTDLPDMAALVLSQAERSALFDRPLSQQSALFLRLWTLKEAVLKASGQGFHHDPRAIDFGSLSSAPLRNYAVATSDGRAWSVSEITLPTGWPAACACERPFVADLLSLTTSDVQTWLATGRRKAR